MELLPPAFVLLLNLLPLLPVVGIPERPPHFPLQRSPGDLEDLVALIFDPRLNSALYGLHTVHPKALIGSTGQEELTNVLPMEGFAEILRGGRLRGPEKRRIACSSARICYKLLSFIFGLITIWVPIIRKIFVISPYTFRNLKFSNSLVKSQDLPYNLIQFS